MSVRSRRYRIFDTCWHIAHQHDMITALRDDCDFYFTLNTKRQWSAQEERCVRPIPENLHFVTHYEAGQYDVAILHIDQQVVSPFHEKRVIFDQLNRAITDIPKIVINHGSPVCPQGLSRAGASRKDMERECAGIVKRLVGNHLMVVNSHAAATGDEWGFGIPVVHGIDPGLWYDLPKEPRVFTALSPAGLDEYYNRNCTWEVSRILSEQYGYMLWFAKVNVPTHESFDKYRDFLGRSLLYLDTSFRTPMNRARTEAFLSGCCVIQVAGAHDLGRWAVEDENIVIVPDDPAAIAALIVDLIESRYSHARNIGKAGKAMAMEKFSPGRYREDWLNILRQVCG